MRLRSCLTLPLAGLAGTLCMAAQAASFTACAEPADGPPWLYRDASRANGLAGFTADFWPVLFQAQGHSLTIRGDLPFKRCLRAVAAGEVDFVLGAYRDEERARELAFSEPLRTLTPQVFFRQDHPLRIQARADLRQWRGCGMNGSSYAHYGLNPGDLDQGARSYRTLIEKLMVGRCDYFVEELEVIERLDHGRQRLLETPGLAHGPVPDVPRPSLHLAARLGSPAAAEMPALNAAYAQSMKSGELLKIWRRYAPTLPY